MGELYGRFAWEIGMGDLYGSEICMGDLYGRFVWEVCMGEMCKTV